MKIASVAEVKSRFSALLKASEAGPVIVTRRGRPVAVIIGVQAPRRLGIMAMVHCLLTKRRPDVACPKVPFLRRWIKSAAFRTRPHGG
jgi:prevent-host-death family protein